MDKMLLSILNKKRVLAYRNPKSVLKKYQKLLEFHGIYFSLNHNILSKNIVGRTDLCPGILQLYEEAQLENEQIMLLEDLLTIGYDKNKLVEIILSVFEGKNIPSNLWEYGDLLFTIKNYNYMPHYLKIIQNESLKEDRQMLILLVGKSEMSSVIPILLSLVDDSTVCGHALEALSNFSGDEIDGLMRKYLKCDVKWIRSIAEKYFS